MKYLTQDDLLEEGYEKLIDGNRYYYMTPYKVKVRYRERNVWNNTLYRDMPLGIVERFIKMAEIYDPEITFAIVLMAYAGLREGEVCNIRRKDSCYGPGIYIRYGKQKIDMGDYEENMLICESIELDLLGELLMREDGISVGKIKRKRMQAVYSGYTDIIYRYYERHIKLIERKECEASKPMFLCKNRKRGQKVYYALTKKGLQNRIKNLFTKHVLPSMSSDENEKFQLFYAQMQNHTWGPHSFRHWFTVSLVLMGCDEITIQSARGDRNRNSSKLYLERKGELQNLYREAVNTLGVMIRKDS